MIADPSIAVQRAVFAALTGFAPLTALVGAGVYDRAPPGASLPWVTIGADDVHDDSAENLDGAEVYANISCWSDVSKASAKAIAVQAMLAVAQVLDLSADGQRCIDFLVETVRAIDPADGENFRSIITVKYLTEPLVQPG